MNDLDGHLRRTMKQINEMDSCGRDRISKDFEKSMKAAFRIFGEDAFRKRHDPKEKRRPVSKALFEVWSAGPARRSDQEIGALVSKRKKIIDQFTALMNEDQEFETAISYATGIPVRIRKRFRAIDESIEERLRCRGASNRGISSVSRTWSWLSLR